MKGGPISSVKALEDGVVKVNFTSGNTICLDMKPKFSLYRFGVLSDTVVFSSASTDGDFVRWYKDGLIVVELAFDEIIQMTLGESF